MRMYADTSVFGGCFDEEFRRPSEAFFDQVKTGVFSLCMSALVAEEIESAPPRIRQLFQETVLEAEFIDVDQRAIDLQQAYISEGILAEKSLSDALHVALATVAECDVIVSWNFKHIVHFQKIARYNAVSVLHGYRAISIHSPSQVISYDE